MPFGLNVSSKNTLIFSCIAGGIAGLVYSSKRCAQDTKAGLTQRVSFLADRPNENLKKFEPTPTEEIN
ncbi:uncharacterized protein EV154DRAFT_561746 [Mucor mucedo]|uniref:uncharacterized protein n=1 Tax=Mucor mucedo TaxID=29922 RepID=UPI00222022BF|nr:uncharacterized protein EV154DRAFT_561746 [Mucor mucedo]KAI7893065.1 hypothetical protein EV154DRAFT_561746 [Mucor mucedo]